MLKCNQFIHFCTMLLVLFISLFLSSHAAKFPKTWTACKKDSPGINECLKNAMNFAIHDLVPGNPSLGVLPIDPMHFDALTIDQGSGPVSIRLDFANMDVLGLKNLKVTKVEGTDWKTMEFHYTINPQLTLQGKYKIKGQVLILPINGDGDFKLAMDNFRGIAKLKLSEKENKGKKHYNVDTYSFTFDTDKLDVNFENLFNGDKRLGENMNKFLNQNWKEILNELKPSIAKSFSVAYKEISNRIFSRLEIDAVTP